MAGDTYLLQTAEVDLAYDVYGELPAADGRPLIVMIGQPMAGRGFATRSCCCPTLTPPCGLAPGFATSTKPAGWGPGWRPSSHDTVLV